MALPYTTSDVTCTSFHHQFPSTKHWAPPTGPGGGMYGGERGEGFGDGAGDVAGLGTGDGESGPADGFVGALLPPQPCNKDPEPSSKSAHAGTNEARRATLHRCEGIGMNVVTSTAC